MAASGLKVYFIDDKEKNRLSLSPCLLFLLPRLLLLFLERIPACLSLQIPFHYAQRHINGIKPLNGE